VHQLTTPEGLFSALLSADPGRPFVTYYDEASGERSELSRKSLANWVAKTHFLLLDELGLGVGDVALIDVPAHWISVPILLGALTAGLELTDTDAARASIAFVAAPADPPEVPDVYAIAPDSAAVGLRDAVPADLSDYVTAVRPQPDAWTAVQLSADPKTPCVPGYTREATVSFARSRARDLGAPDGARLLTTRDWTGPADWIDTLFVALVAGGSLVIVRNAPDEGVVERRMSQERATVRI
jgi:uncharacterized protein (TIGR03089 family)